MSEPSPRALVEELNETRRRLFELQRMAGLDQMARLEGEVRRLRQELARTRWSPRRVAPALLNRLLPRGTRRRKLVKSAVKFPFKLLRPSGKGAAPATTQDQTPAPVPMTADRQAKILGLVVCPRCRSRLDRSGESLHCAGCRGTYPIVVGRPVFVPAGAEVTIMPETHLSNQPVPSVMDRVAWTPGWVLNLGAGGTATKVENVVEMEYSLFRNTDVSADAHRLPFADATFEAVITFNTFEHLAEPHVAAAEIHRVLKPGGWLFLHTAFLQPLHESPYHFYDCTEWGLRQWFQQFQISEVSVSENFHPGYTLAFLACTALHAVSSCGPELRALAGSSTLEEWSAAWTNPETRDNPLWRAFQTMPQDLQKVFAAGFQLQATKAKT